MRASSKSQISHLRQKNSFRPYVELLEDRTLLAPAMLDPNLAVRTAVSGLNFPATMGFIGNDDFFVLERTVGKVQRVQLERNESGNVTSVTKTEALDLTINSSSERGLLGIAVHPDFPANPGVYLYWTCVGLPTEERCAEQPAASGIDSADPSQVPLRANRVDRFVWDGSKLNFERNLIMVRALQTDQGTAFGNHNGGVLRFGLKGKDRGTLYVIVGDVGRRGNMQNLATGPFGPMFPDDPFGGPEPDNAHMTSIVLRLNPDGSAPLDNPFYQFGAEVGGEVGANVQKIFAYGVRNSFGLTVDPKTGFLWDAQNGDDSFDEINRVEPGMNGGWIQVMGPVGRVAQFKQIESGMGASPAYAGMQQVRWPPSNIADTPGEALMRMYRLPGSVYSDPEFSWKYAVPPAALGFINGGALGGEYQGDLLVGAATGQTDGGYLFRFELNGRRREFVFSDIRLTDRVADNEDKHRITESETLRFGTGFRITTDIQTAPNGNVFVVGLLDGAVYEIYRKPVTKDSDDSDGASAAIASALSGPSAPNPDDASVSDPAPGTTDAVVPDAELDAIDLFYASIEEETPSLLVDSGEETLTPSEVLMASTSETGVDPL